MTWHSAGKSAKEELMITIILSACLIGDVHVCRDHRIPLTADVSTMQCMVSAQFQIAKWTEEHPQWRVVRWKCRLGQEEDI